MVFTQNDSGVINRPAKTFFKDFAKTSAKVLVCLTLNRADESEDVWEFEGF